jgi:hypothetical protein
MNGRVNTSSIAHEVFNNIFIRVSGQVGSTARYNSTSPFPGWSDHCLVKLQCDGSSREFWDYNILWRDPALAPFAHGLLDEIGNRPDTNESDYASLANFRNNVFSGGSGGHFNLSKSIYAPGFEANSFEFKPTMASIDSFPANRLDYRPSPHANRTTGKTTSLSGESTAGWPAQPSNWKGALDPAGTTMPVGVQNP